MEGSRVTILITAKVSAKNSSSYGIAEIKYFICNTGYQVIIKNAREEEYLITYRMFSRLSEKKKRDIITKSPSKVI